MVFIIFSPVPYDALACLQAFAGAGRTHTSEPLAKN